MPVHMVITREPIARASLSAVIGLFAAIVAMTAGQASAQDKLKPIQPITALYTAIDISGGRFEVVDSRFEETGTATVLFGIVGGMVNSGINGDEDRKKALPYQAAASGLEPGRILHEKLRATLEGKALPLSEAEKGASQALRIELKEWGLTRTSQRDLHLASFVRIHVVMKQGGKTVWDVYLKDSGGRAAMLVDTTEDMLVEDIESLAAKLGERIAYEIIYR